MVRVRRRRLLSGRPSRRHEPGRIDTHVIRVLPVRHFALADVDRGWPYAACFLLWCLLAAATAAVTTVSALILMRLLIGAAESVVIPATYRHLADHFAEHRKGTALGIVSTGGKMGPALGAPIAAWMIVNASWPVMFAATGLVGLVWLAPWLLMVRSDHPTKPRLEARMRDASSVPLSNVLASPVVWGGLVNNFCYAYFNFYCMTWMPAYLVEQRGLSLEKSGPKSA